MTVTEQHRVWPLPGGIYLEPHKARSLGSAIGKPPLPQQLVLCVTQPDSANAILDVQAGDYVLKGQLLAHGMDDTGINIHASTSGTVLAIRPHVLPNTSGFEELCVILQPDGEERWTRMPPIPDFTQCSREIIYARIQQAGIRGLGGAAFPSHAKLAPGSRIHTLVLNACECEPFISCDEALLKQYAADVVTGVQILLQASHAVRCLIGIEDNKPAAINTLRAVLTDPRIELVVIPAQYPSGAERQLIYTLTGITIATETLPVEKGFLCHNPATALAVMRAVVFGEAMVSRVTTVTGAALATSGNFEVLLGTPINELLLLCGIDTTQLSRLISGGPLMGTQIANLEAPVMVTTNCVLATTAAELPAALPEQACIRCGFCVAACPVLLQPQVLYWHTRQQALAAATAHHLHDCIECGACAYVCPSHIPLVQYFRAAKAAIHIEQAHVAVANTSRERFEFHQARGHEEKLRQEQRRAERAALSQQTHEQVPDANGAQATIAAALARVKAKKIEQSVTANTNKQNNGDTGP